MESKDGPILPEEAEGASKEAEDKAKIALSREILHILSHTMTAMKLFPWYHATVVQHMDDLHEKLTSYFETREELEVDVTDQAFFVGGEAIYKDDNLSKSLPYLFHKDGMRQFTILREIDKTELRDFLEVIRKAALQPLDESDVVLALLEKDFANIRIFAPDEYLLSKVDIFTKQPTEVLVDRNKLFSGRIELSDEDTKDIKSNTMSLALMDLEEQKDYAKLVTTLEEKDRDRLESLLAAARQTTPEQEFHDMVFELLCLEDDAQKIIPILDFLERHLRELLRDDKFTDAVYLLKQSRELEKIFSARSPGKTAELQKFLAAFQDGRTIELIQGAIGRRSFDSLPAFFDYLSSLGDKSIPLAVELLAKSEEPEVRSVALVYLGAVSRENIEVLASQLQDGQPAVTKEVIGLLARNPSKKGLSCLGALSSYTNQEIKLAAVEALSSLDDPLAHQILLEFLQNEDEEVSAAVADRLRWPGDPNALGRAIKMISARSFDDKGGKAKIAVMSFLARSGTPKALKALRRIIERSGFFRKAEREHTQLCAVGALAAAGTPPAKELLTRGLKHSNKKVRKACQRALGMRSDEGEGPPEGQ